MTLLGLAVNRSSKTRKDETVLSFPPISNRTVSIRSILLLITLGTCSGFIATGVYSFRAKRLPFFTKNSASVRESEDFSSRVAETPNMAFQSSMYMLYIEDTDSYGIMYNSNYLKFAERALFTDFLGREACCLENNRTIVSLVDQRFKAAAQLGASFYLKGERREQSQGKEVWYIEVRNDETLYNTILMEISDTFAPELSLSETTTDVSNLFVDEFSVYRDEFDPFRGVILLRSILNMFERSRSNWLGGPDGLRRLKEEDGILYVVTQVKDLVLFPEARSCLPGNKIRVQTGFFSRRNGMVITCSHSAYLGEDCIASGQVILMAIDDAARKPTSNIPKWLVQRMQT